MSAEAHGNEWRYYGPPGTGKTTTLTRQTQHAAERFGSDNVLIASLTRAAAQEIAGRDLRIPRSNVSTLHSHAYRAIGRPPVAAKLAKEFSEEFPQYALSESKTEVDDDAAMQRSNGEKPGDALLERYSLYRTLMRPREVWPKDVTVFAVAWEDFKDKTGSVDFADMILIALDEIPSAPGGPTVGIFDEVQDFGRAELALCRKWGARMEYFICAGDDDQGIYHWRGATPDAFLKPDIPAERKRILSQSYRIPRSVHRLAARWIEQLGYREPKPYNPREEEGTVRRLDLSWKRAESLLSDAQKYFDEGKSVAFIGTCGYFLEPLIAVMRGEGRPFHNPWKRNNGRWNPLGGGRGRSGASRLLSFLAPDEEAWGEHASDLWSPDDLRAWVQPLKSEVLTHGAKAEIERAEEVTLERLRGWFPPETLERAFECDVEWFKANVLPSKRKPFDFPCAVLRRHGAKALRETPQAIVSTVHGCKGGQADVVYLFPDLSPAGYSEWERDPDPVRRVFYVGMTRAKETLILCEAGDARSVEIG